MSWAEWCSTPWDEQRALLEGLSDDKQVPFEYQMALAPLPAGFGPQTREGVDAGMHVINLAEMRRGLEAGREKKPGQLGWKSEQYQTGAGPGQEGGD